MINKIFIFITLYLLNGVYFLLNNSILGIIIVILNITIFTIGFYNKNYDNLIHIYVIILFSSIEQLSFLGDDPAAIQDYNAFISIQTIKFFGISLSMFMLLFLLLFLFLKRKNLLISRLKNFKNIPILILVIFLFFSSFIGILGTFYNSASFIYFKEDIFSYLFFILFAILLFFIRSYGNLNFLFLSIILASIFIECIFLFLGVKVKYASSEFVLANALFFYTPIVIFLFKNIIIKLFILGVFSVFIVFGFYQPSGKLILEILFVFIVFIFNHLKQGLLSKVIFIILTGLFILFLFNINQIISILDEYNFHVLSSKLGQVQLILFYLDKIDLTQSSSVVNIIAEYLTLQNHMLNEFKFFLYGNGIGGYISDSMGLLQYANEFSYSDLAISMNEYRSFHLPLYDFILYGGVVGILVFTFVIVFVYQQSSNKKYALLFIVSFVLMHGYSSKSHQLIISISYVLALFYTNNQTKDKINAI